MRQIQNDVIAVDDVLARASVRRHDIDWLRTLACYGVLVFHAVMVFGPESFYHIRNIPVSFKVVVFIRFMALWYMPLFFVVAGWATFVSLQARGTRRFLRERVRRLLLPLIVGCVLFGPPIKYFELRSGMDANYLGLRVSAELQESFKPFVYGGHPSRGPPSTRAFPSSGRPTSRGSSASPGHISGSSPTCSFSPCFTFLCSCG